VRRHPFDPVSLIFGLLFAVIAVLGLTDAVTLSYLDLRWIAPGALVLLGLALVLTSGRRGSDAADADDGPPVVDADRVDAV
jgi:hypothetical protein